MHHMRNPDIAISTYGFIRRRQQETESMKMLVLETEKANNGMGRLPFEDKVLWVSLFSAAFVLFLIVGL